MFKPSRKRPFVGILLAFVLGILFAGFLNLGLLITSIILAIVAVIAFFTKDFLLKSIYTTFSIVLVGSVASIINRPASTIPLNQRLYIDLSVDDMVSVSGRWNRATAQINSYALDSLPQSWHKEYQRVNLYVDTSINVNVGERLVVRSYLNPVQSTSSSFIRLISARGLTHNIFVGSDRNLLSRSDDMPWWFGLSSRMNRCALETIDRLDVDSAGLCLAKAMTLGSKASMSTSLKDAYARTGTAHLLAVSGLHAGFVFAVLMLLFWWMPILPFGHVYKSLLVIAGLWGFAMVAGMSASIVRATIMLSLFQVALAFSREVDRYNVLAAAAVVMLVVNPMWLYDISFQLSFMAVLSILFFLPRLLKVVRFKNKALRYLWSLFMVGLAAQIGVLPLLCFSFGVLSVAGLFITPLLLIFSFTIVSTTLLWLCLPLSFIEPLCSWLISFASNIQNKIVICAAQWSLASFDVRFTGADVLVYYGVLIMVMTIIKYVEYRKILKGIYDD